MIDEKCSNCSGTGMVPCDCANGSLMPAAEASCLACRGRGQVSCPACGGTGLADVE
jgi:DnaJ-class molecular chaperone